MSLFRGPIPLRRCLFIYLYVLGGEIPIQFEHKRNPVEYLVPAVLNTSSLGGLVAAFRFTFDYLGLECVKKVCQKRTNLVKNLSKGRHWTTQAGGIQNHRGQVFNRMPFRIQILLVSLPRSVELDIPPSRRRGPQPKGVPLGLGLFLIIL